MNMDIRKAQPNGQPDSRGAKLAQGLEQIARSKEKNAQQIRNTKQRVEAHAAQVDRLDLSSSAQELEAAETDSRRAAHLAELKVAYDEGRLNTPERVEQAAERMLDERSE
jgi:hypothetical protein